MSNYSVFLPSYSIGVDSCKRYHMLQEDMVIK